MNSFDVVGFTYEADTHCVVCTRTRFGEDADTRDPAPEDDEGNRITPIFADQSEDDDRCGTCGGLLME